MNEAETRAELIDPALKAAGWGEVEGSVIRREYSITLGRLQGHGRRSQPLSADYVLIYKNKKLAVIEAKRRNLPDTEGLAQAKDYAARLKVPYTYSTNGKGVYEVDMTSGDEGYIDDLPAFPSPEDLWQRTFARKNEWRDRFSAIPFEDKGGTWQPRYYQDNAIEKTLEAITAGRDRILLTLATGTGKTAIAFQLVWKLFHAKWNLSRGASRRPRILFLADRNILADQAYNSFGAFEEDALVRIDPEVIRKKGRVPKNGSVFFTIFQTFMTGTDDDGKSKPSFGEYPSDFFDFIIIDECHRGGANDESSWREVLEYFKPAVQLGLTATPKRKDNVDTYEYFGKPVYEYSLKEGINDGFLTPFRVRQIATTIDDYVFTSDDDVVQGEVVPSKRYREEEFNRSDGIVISKREMKRVKVIMDEMNQGEKTLVFCAGQPHALMIRDMINQVKDSDHPDYCVRVSADDGGIGETFLRTFQDNEKTIPTVLTTSTKLSTGVDARNVRNIVLLRPVKSMIEFKQIIGRGTRLFDDKDYFTIYDFVKAYEHFEDPEWDGEPLEPEPGPTGGGGGTPPGGEPDETDPDEPEEEPKTLVIELAPGKERQIQHMAVTTFWSPEGTPISAADFIRKLFGDLPEYFKDEDELRTLWGQPETRRALLDGLAEKGYGSDQLDEIRLLIDAESSDLFDVLAYVAFELAPITREERVETHRNAIYEPYDAKLQAFLDFVLSQYVQEGVGELDQEKLPQLLELKYSGVREAAEELGEVGRIRDAFVGFQRFLYEGETE
jgi:type I restriction enzyme, R subunit